MADETEYKGFRISLRLRDSAWTATIEKCDGALLLLSLPGSNHVRMQSFDTPPEDSAVDAMKLALDVIDSGALL